MKNLLLELSDATHDDPVITLFNSDVFFTVFIRSASHKYSSNPRPVDG